MTCTSKRRVSLSRTKSSLLTFILPGMAVLTAFVIAPVFYAFYLGLTELKVGSFAFVGLGNFEKLIKDRVFWISLVNTIYYTLGVVVPSIVISLLLAVALNRKSKLAYALRTIYFLPVALSEAVAAAIWLAVLNPDVGLANYILQLLKLPKIGWYADYTWAMPTLIMVSLWKNVGYYMIIFLAGLQSIPAEYYEAAQLDGAGWWHLFKNITVPLLRPSLFFVYITSIIFSFRVFTWIFVMTLGGPGYATMTTVFLIYREGFKKFNFGYASAMSCVLFVILLILIVFQVRSFRALEEEASYR